MSELKYTFGQVIDLLKDNPDTYKFRETDEEGNNFTNYCLRCTYIKDIPIYYEEFDDGTETVFFWSDIMAFPEILIRRWKLELI